MKLQENNSLKYRQIIVEAKRAWDEKPTQKIFTAHSAIGKSILSRQKELAIFGGGVGILSKAEGNPILLYSPEVQKHFQFKANAAKFEFLHTPYELELFKAKDKLHFAKFIDLLFFVSRDTKHPEYVRNISDIKKPQPFEYPFQKQLRVKYEILHCSAGEILFFSLLWRLIIELINKNNSLDCLFNELDFSSNNYNSNWVEVFKTDKFDLIEKMIIDKLEIAEKSPENTLSKDVLKARDYFAETLKKQSTPKSILNDLGIFKLEALNEINNYTNFVFGKSFMKLTKTNANEFAYSALCKFADKAIQKGRNISLGDLLNTLHKTARFPILPYYFLMLFDTKKELKEHIVFPLWYTATPDTKYVYEKVKTESAVLHALYTVRPIWKIKKYKNGEWYNAGKKIRDTKINAGFENYLNDLYSFFTSMSKPIIDKEYYAEEAKKNINIVKRQATKAAISQVMARNMSHNIGSHVLSRMIRWNDILTKEETYKSSLNDKLIFDPQSQLEFFNSYLKTRMDFLADIATSTPTIQNTKQFKSELLKGFDDNRLLLNKISGISDFSFTIQVFKNGFELNDGDFPVSISNDVLGFHAFYIILENIIRNTAKHSFSEGTKEGNVIFKIEVIDSDDEIDNSYYQLTISDNIKQRKQIPLNKVEQKKYRHILQPNSTSIQRIDKLVFDQNARLNKSILDDETNLLRQGSWGLIEMDVSAAYLRKISQENVDDDKYQIPLNQVEKTKFSKSSDKEPFKIIEAVQVDDCLGYKLYIPKPKELLIIDRTGETWDVIFKDNPKAFNEWKSKGILFLKGNSNSNDKWSFKENFSYPHELVLFLDSGKTIQSPFISKRQITIEKLKQCFIAFHNKEKKPEEQISVIDLWQLSKEQLIKEVWRTWVHKKMIEKELHLKTDEITYGQFFPLSNTNQKDYQIVLSPHGEHYTGISNGKYFEVFPKSQFEHLHDIIIEAYPSLKQLIEKVKFIDSALTNVLVLDERIQELVLKEKYFLEKNTIVLGGVLFKELWDNVNVYIPEKDEIDLTAKNFSKNYIKKIHDVIEDKFQKGNRIKKDVDGQTKSSDNRTCNGLDFIIIHLGVIEKILKAQNNEKKDEAEISKFVSEIIRKYKNVTVIITSGRGKPENLPMDIPYLGYSIISQYLIENRFKSLFTQTLYSARPQNR